MEIQRTGMTVSYGNIYDICNIYILYIYIYIIYANLPINAVARLPHLGSGDSQGQRTFLASPADKQNKMLYIYIFFFFS